MASSLEASRRYLGAARKLGNARSRSMLSGVTPIPPGGDSTGAFAAKLGSVALDYFSNKELEKYAQEDRQMQMEERELRMRALEAKLNPAPKAAAEMTPYQKWQTENAGQVTPAMEYLEGGRNRRAQGRSSTAASELARARERRLGAQQALKELDATEKADVTRWLSPKNAAMLKVYTDANAARQGDEKALKALGLPPAESGLVTPEHIRMINARVEAIKNARSGGFASMARQKYASRRKQLEAMLQGEEIPLDPAADEEQLSPEEQQFLDALGD